MFKATVPHSPSWRIGGDGQATVEVRAVVNGPNPDHPTFLELRLEETAFPDKYTKSQKYVSRQAFVTLRNQDAKNLYEYLRQAFEDPR